MSFSEELDSLRDRYARVPDWTIARRESDASFRYDEATLDFQGIAVRFSVDRDGRILVDLADGPNAHDWINSCDLTALVSGSDLGFHSATLTSAYDAFIQYLREHETRLRVASKPKRVSNDIGAGGR